MAVTANSTTAPAVPPAAPSRPIHPANVRQVARLCADSSASIRERAAMAHGFNPEECVALRSLGAAIDHVVADWAAEHGGRA